MSVIHQFATLDTAEIKVGQRLRDVSTAMKYSFKAILLEALFLQLNCH